MDQAMEEFRGVKSAAECAAWFNKHRSLGLKKLAHVVADLGKPQVVPLQLPLQVGVGDGAAH